jgi:autotransporter translocation and assembly factor TamB
MLMDTLQLVAGKNDSGQYLHLISDIASAQLQGEYRLTQIGTIIQQSVQPYFNVVPASSIVRTDPYNFTFTAYVADKPLLKTLIPELKEMDTVNIQSRFSSSNGWNAIVSAPHIQYGPNHLYDFHLNAGTNNPDSSRGALQVKTTLSQITNGTNLQILNPSFTANVANNKIDFVYNTKDKNSKDKYHVEGIFSQPTFRNYTLSLDPDSLLLNYDRWTVNTENRINITPTNITANNFELSKGSQKLSLNSTSNVPNAPLDINFTDFRISTITGFFKADSVLADGAINGKATLLEYKTQPVFTSDLTINDYSMNKDTVGNIKLQVNNTTTNTYSVNATITGRGNDVQLTGNYYPKPVDGNSFNLEMDIRKLQLSTVQGASMGNIRGANGTADGKLTVSGTFQDPALVGNIHFDKAGFNVAMLNSYFTLDNQNLEFQENAIHFNEFTIRDTANNKAVIDGYAYT